MGGRSTTGEEFVDHHYIEEAGITDRYLLGKLTPEEQDRFEEHFVDCPECLDRLETTRNFRCALKTAVAEDAARSRAHVQAGLLAWLVSRSHWQLAALLLAMILLPAVLATTFFVPKIRRAQEELEQAKKASSDWHDRFEEQQQAASRLEKELQEANAYLTKQRRQLETRQEGESQTPLGGEREATGSSPPQVPPPVFALSIVRSADPGLSEPENRISIPRSARSFVLSLELENGSGVQSYRATITTADQRVIWTRSNLKPHTKDTLRINLNSNLVGAGDYQLTLEGLTREGNYVPAGRYGFRMSETK
jgi:putative zinc finger protein